MSDEPTIFDRIRTLEAMVEAYKMLTEKALNLAMEALVEIKAMKATTHTVQYVNPFDDIKPQKTEMDVIKDVKFSPFNLNPKVMTEKVEVEKNGNQDYEDLMGE